MTTEGETSLVSDGDQSSPNDLQVLSMGWGVQSWTLAAMSALGELPKLDFIIHGDTRHERAGTYEHAEKWTPWLAERGIPVLTVTAKNTDVPYYMPKKDYYWTPIPAKNIDPDTGKKGMLRRECTGVWKIRPANKEINRLRRLRGKNVQVKNWLGISIDEWSRMRSNPIKWMENVYPLVEKRISRDDCIQWLKDHGLDVPPKSACVFCPYHDPGAWAELALKGGPDLDHAIQVDEDIRNGPSGYKNFVHKEAIPLIEVVTRIREAGPGVESEGWGKDDETECDGGVCFV